MSKVGIALAAWAVGGFVLTMLHIWLFQGHQALTNNETAIAWCFLCLFAAGIFIEWR